MYIQPDAHLRINYKNDKAERSGGYGYEHGHEYINRNCDVGVYKNLQKKK